MDTKTKYILLIALVLILIGVSASGIAPQTLKTATKCYFFYDGGITAAKICKTQTFYWAPSSPYAVDCSGQGSGSWTNYNGYTMDQKDNYCANYSNHSTGAATARIKRPNGTVLLTGAGTAGYSWDGQINYINWNKWP